MNSGLCLQGRSRFGQRWLAQRLAVGGGLGWPIDTLDLLWGLIGIDS